MDAREEKQYAMTTVLVKFLADNAAAIGVSQVAAAEAADIAPAYERLTQAVGTAPLSTTANTGQATDARTALLAALPALLGPLRSVATKAKDAGLLARATLSARQLRKLRPEELRDVSKAFFEAADAHAQELGAYGLTAPVLAQLRALHTAFAPTVRSTASLIDQRSQGNEAASDLLRDLMQQVYELDKPMEVFRFLNSTLYAGYKRARRVGSTGGGTAADPGNASGPSESK
jgi:hypothetical protein